MKWNSVKDALPEKGKGFILVTNNINARDAFDNMSNVWLSRMLHKVDGEYVSFAYPTIGSRVEGITHWAYVTPQEDWFPDDERTPNKTPHPIGMVAKSSHSGLKILVSNVPLDHMDDIVLGSKVYVMK